MENFDAVLHKMTDMFVWRPGWPLDSVSKPPDTSELRLALKAFILERMVELWSAPPKNSSEKTPAWCAEIPALKERFNIIKPDEQAFWEDEPCISIIEKRNIFASKDFIFFS